MAGYRKFSWFSVPLKWRKTIGRFCVFNNPTVSLWKERKINFSRNCEHIHLAVKKWKYIETLCDDTPSATLLSVICDLLEFLIFVVWSFFSYALMSECWEKEANDRPTFEFISSTIGRLQRCHKVRSFGFKRVFCAVLSHSTRPMIGQFHRMTLLDSWNSSVLHFIHNTCKVRRLHETLCLPEMTVWSAGTAYDVWAGFVAVNFPR